MKVKETLSWGAKQLKYSSSPRLDVEVLLAYILKTDRASLMREPSLNITSIQLKQYSALIKERGDSKPVAHLTGVKEFFGLPFYVNRYTLIPRPETEALVTRAIEIVRKKNIKTIYDVGTGSGNIAIALAKNLPHTTIIASDICKRALNVAKRNVRKHKLDSRVQLVHSNLAEHIETAELIVANLPYVPQHYQVSQDILFEPKKALFAGKDGLDLYQEFFQNQIFNIFKGTCLVELGSRQRQAMTNWLKHRFPKVKISPIPNIDGEMCGLEIDFS